ncbi:IEV transmembrane phosphoprotein [Vaccinia virus]|uniref:EEV membrane protein n=2 Tax=Vaccinia virus TaxID=10245 RepID=O57238_VACCA|nr:EEV membrane protein [Vaccinia virus]QOS44680.1 MVA147R [synthetic construct]AAT10545.1 IEV transmembrane phosphoprotein [Vaccinia virus]AUO38459.1 IEV transmembrane phosphoprotein [Vaccinia virus]QCI57176.1 IEV transmembrane phosphoprotein [Vaccinia virus]
MMLVPLITVTVVAGTILVCYILYICRKKIRTVYNDNKIIMTKLKKIKSSNSSKSSKSTDSESDWEDHCSAMEQNNDVDNISRNEILDDDSFAGSLIWDNESNVMAPSTEHIYDSVAGSTLLINNDRNEQTIYQNTTVVLNEDTKQNPNYSSNPFVNYNKTSICSKSNPFITELNNKFSENNPFRRAHSDDYLNKQEQDHEHDDIESLV